MPKQGLNRISEGRETRIVEIPACLYLIPTSLHPKPLTSEPLTLHLHPLTLKRLKLETFDPETLNPKQTCNIAGLVIRVVEPCGTWDKLSLLLFEKQKKRILNWGSPLRVSCRNLITKPWAFIRVPYMNPTVLVL